MNISKEIGHYVCNTSYNELSKEVVEQAKRCIIDWFGVAIGGSREAVTKILIDYVEMIGGNPQATIIGSGLKTNVINAALVNGAMSHVLDYDDTHEASLVHPSSPLVPSILAVAELKKATGKDLITAYVLGYNVEVNIGAAIQPYTINNGWHPTSVFGRLGAAAGVGKIMKLQEKEIAHALGIAATQSAGLRKVFGSMCKPFHPGKAAADGILSCLLANNGFTSSDYIFEGDIGFLGIFSAKHLSSKTLKIDFNLTFEINNNCFKPYAACLLTHPIIEAGCMIRKKINNKTNNIKNIICQVSPLAMNAAGIVSPKTGLEGKFSLYYCIALSLLKGNANQSQFTDDQVNSAQVKYIMNKVDIKSNPNLGITEAYVDVLINDGTVYEQKVNKPKGYPDNPMTDKEIKHKFTDLAAPYMGTDKANLLLRTLEKLEKIKDVSKIMEICA